MPIFLRNDDSTKNERPHKLTQQYVKAYATVREGLCEYTCKLTQQYVKAYATIREGLYEYTCKLVRIYV